jgi:GDP-L-fucose synthase
MPTNLYGPNDNFKNGESHVLPAFIRRFVEATESNSASVEMWGTGAPLREFLHADDLAAAVLIASEKYDSELHLNIGSAVEISVRDLASLVAKVCGYKGQIQWDTTKPDGTPRKVLDISRASQMGWSPRITLEAGIASTVAWYKEANARGGVRK